MKKLYSCLIILTFFTSCSIDSNTSKQDATTSMANRTVNLLPGNIDNPYDEAGWLHNEIFESYYAGGNLANSVLGIANRVEAIAAANTGFNVIKTSTYHPVSPERIEYLLEHKNTCLAEVISASSMTAKAKTSLSNFIISLIAVFDRETNCDVLYKFVADYEKVVLSDSSFTTNDKRIMLITTSIARHSAYLAKKRPKKNTDPDWTILVVNIAAAADGAEYGIAECVTEGLVGGIASN
ncbi:MAG: hypothetical protein C0525_11505 [Flavobacterium sp.]|uniref:hypothetical protein n=1 Tax=Flavobacterium sp. TaxID=239 RepID=UPI0025BA82FE|nr:hypothetical protein [Flavobacterium sp.]MBA4135341.1 hypothetical protein [Flavobacterium sp.]